MTIKEKLEKLANEKNNPCVTISLSSHKTHPDNLQDAINLKNLVKQAEERVIHEFGKRTSEPLLKKLSEVEKEIDINYNLNSLHIFLSNDTKEIIRSDWKIKENNVHIANNFNIRPIIKIYNRSEDYYILLLSQSGVHLFHAINDVIQNEVTNSDFPFPENWHYSTQSDKKSDAKHLDNLVREFLNKIDKAAVKIHHETGLNFVVICTEDNYSRLMQVADKPHIYTGYSSIDYNHINKDQLAAQAWKIMLEKQAGFRNSSIEEMNEAVSQGNVITDLQEIHQAALDGRGELLIVHEDFHQSVVMTDTRHFKLTHDSTEPNAIDDITSNIAWEVLSKNGRVVFTEQTEIKNLGKIVLKVRY